MRLIRATTCGNEAQGGNRQHNGQRFQQSKHVIDSPEGSFVD
jgi:hypothetical protein